MIRWSHIRENPVFVKEMRVGFREKKVFFALTAWVILVALFASIFSAAALTETKAISELPEAGKFLFEMLFWVQLVLLAMLAPALTTSAVSGERERQSFEMLLTTHLAPSELIFGKFGFAASFLALALFATVPLEAIVFFLGGVSLSTFLYGKIVLLAAGVLISLLGLMLSARETRSAYATGQTYLCLMMLGGPALSSVGALRYADNIPTNVYVMGWLIAVYLMLFCFWKSVNHLEERAVHLRIVLGVGAAFYLLVIAASLATDDLWGNINNSFWSLYAPAQYLLMGLLLNPNRPQKARERELFAGSILSRPLLWVGLLTVGTLLPNIYALDFTSSAISVYTLLAGLGTVCLARGLSARNPARYPYVLGFGWLLLNVVPAFFAIGGISTDQQAYHPAAISPIFFLITAFDEGWNDPPFTAAFFYGALILFGLLMEFRRGKSAAAKG